MTSLADIQDALQRAILGTPDQAATLIAAPPTGNADSRLAVYTTGYRLRLAEFLSNDYPKLLAYLGDVRFRRMAEAYIRAHPSQHPNARWYARALPDHLQQDTAFRRHPEVAELALLERALNDAFDGPDSPACTLADLARFDASEVAGVSFTLAPSLSLLKVTTNVTGIWASLKCGETPPAPEVLDVPAEILAWRQAGSSRFRILGAEESMAVACVRDGMAFGHLCEMMAAFDDPDGAALRAAGYLRGWFEAEIVSCIRRAEAGAK